MTEEAWLSSQDHQPMLEFLQGRGSDRGLRLFAVACCQNYGHLLADERCRQAVQVGERFAEGLATAGERSEAEDAVWRAVESGELWEEGAGPACAYCCYQNEDGSYPSGIAREAANQMLVAAGDEISTDERYESECRTLAGLLRCLFGNPFDPVTADRSWRTATAVSLAQGIYDERAFDRLPILADALQDADCNDSRILGHCRSGGPHARGCWVVDLILKKMSFALPMPTI